MNSRIQKVSDATPLVIAGRIAAAGTPQALPDPAEPQSLAAARDVIRELRAELAAATERAEAAESSVKELRSKLVLAERITPAPSGKSADATPAITRHPAPEPAAAKASRPAFGLTGSDAAWKQSIRDAEENLAAARAELNSADTPTAKTTAFRAFRKAERALADAKLGRGVAR